MKIGIIGAGGFGTALAWHLSNLGHRVKIWCHEIEVAHEIRVNGTNSSYLPGVKLNGVQATTDFLFALAKAEMVILAVPTKFLREVLSAINKSLPFVPIVNVAKGIEPESLHFIDDLHRLFLPNTRYELSAFLSGPSFAKELVKRCPTVVCVAAEIPAIAEAVQKLLSCDYLRVYTTTDVKGVLVGGALKNVIAIAAGICDGLELGDNAKAALVTRGLSEIAKLGMALGGKLETFLGLSGMGDLTLTCGSRKSRNYSVGLLIGQGYRPATALEKVCGQMEIAEGITTSQAIVKLSEKLNLELPICQQVYEILNENKPPAKAIAELMQRELKSEME